MDFGMIVFPKWTNSLKYLAGAALLVAPVFAVALVWYGGSPKTTDVGYAPIQPVAYSHKVHAGDLGIDCRYCHGPVERGARATIPPTDTCMNCHSTIAPDLETTALIRESHASGEPIDWIRVHDLPDYAYFNHASHVSKGVGCASCHGPVDQMEVVTQVETLSMSWCLDCHRDPGPNLRPEGTITQMDWTPPEENAAEFESVLVRKWNIKASTDCSTCHR